jgi:hypothetical protein
VPMRMIVKKSCRAMVEPPEKGERATLNPNLTLCVVINGRHDRLYQYVAAGHRHADMHRPRA